MPRSIWITIFNCGGCNGCYSELLQSECSVYGAENFGIKYVINPVKADVLVVTGTVTQNNFLNIRKVASGMRKPAAVFSVGECALSLNDYMNTSGHIEGCPPNPEEIIKAVISMENSRGELK